MPQLQPFWDPAATFEDPGPYGGLQQFAGFDTPRVGFNGTYSDNPWDTFKAKGLQFPGVCSVSVTRARALFTLSQPQAAPQTTVVGWDPLRFSVSVRVWTPAQWQALQPIIWTLQPIEAKRTARATKGKPPSDTAVDVYHPSLAAQSVKSAICEKIGPMSDGQLRTITFQFLEYSKAPGKVTQIANSVQVVEVYDEPTLANQNVRAADGKVTNYTPTQGPQKKPSTSGVTLTRTP